MSKFIKWNEFIKKLFLKFYLRSAKNILKLTRCHARKILKYNTEFIKIITLLARLKFRKIKQCFDVKIFLSY